MNPDNSFFYFYYWCKIIMMMILRWFFMLSLIAIVTFCDEEFEQSKECMFTKSKPNSCLYFVMRKDKYHYIAADYCFNVFNGAAVPIFYSLNEAYEVMNRYYWWAKSDPNVPRLRFGVFDVGPYPYEYGKTNNASGAWYSQTNFNPAKKLGKDMDMNIWDRSFPRYTTVFLSYDTYDKSKYNLTTLSEAHSDQYLAIDPTTRKWSNMANREPAPFICEVPRFPKAFCEEGWWLHMKSRSCFFLNTNELRFQSAALACREKGSNLASINDETENKMALKMIHQIDRNDSRVWFGLRHEASRAIQGAGPKDTHSLAYAKYFAEYLGYNVDGTPVSTFTYFGNHQPDGVMLNAHENCFLYEAEINDKNNRWNDYPCDTTSAMSLCRKMSSSQPYHS